MKKIKLLFLILVAPFISNAQQITGDWYGLLKVQGMELPLVFHIEAKEDGYSATMDSPKQKAFGMPVSSITFTDGQLDIQMAAIGARYKGELTDQKVEGKFYQANQSFPMTLQTEPLEEKKINRPQEPKEPFPYSSEEVKFSSANGTVTLAGTLTKPKGKNNFPTAILISGSGPQNRDEEFMTHKPFLVLADHLTRNGIAVLRYDDRGFAASTGNHSTATSADFAVDVNAAITYLEKREDIDPDKIGLIGHSEGGLIAPIVAAEKDINFMVLLAAPGIAGEEISIRQLEMIGKLNGLTEEEIKLEKEVMAGIFELIKSYEEQDILKDKLDAYISEQLEKNDVQLEGMTKEEYKRVQIAQLTRPWMRYFVQYDPKANLSKVKCPVLVLNGEKDIQVGPENLVIIKEALAAGGNNDVSIKELKNMNHLFQECESCAMEEYASIETTMEPEVLEMISSWIINKEDD